MSSRVNAVFPLIYLNARPPPIVMLPARLGRRKGGNVRFFDDRDDTPEQIIGDVLGLVVYVAIMALIVDAVIPH